MFLGVPELASLGLGQRREMVSYWVKRPAMAIVETTTNMRIGQLCKSPLLT
jgi:hypothetical protein